MSAPSLFPRSFLLQWFDEFDPCPKNEIIPLTANFEKLKTEVANLTEIGGTAGQIGIEWGWYLLSKKWEQYLPVGSKPIAYKKNETKKIMIIMTDGAFNVEYAGAGIPAELITPPGRNAYEKDIYRKNAVYYAVYQGYGGFDKTVLTRSMIRAAKLCTNIKAAGEIEIYTIGFRLETPLEKRTMSDCASTDTTRNKHYFDAQDGDQLKAAFREISTNIEKLRLVN